MRKKIKIMLVIILTLLVGILGLLFVEYVVLDEKKYDNNTNDVIDVTTIPATSVKPSINPTVVPTKEPLITPTMELDDKSVKLVFAGDVLFTKNHFSSLDNNGALGVLSKEILDKMIEADITMVNQEFPFSNIGTAMEDKQYTFRIDPKYVTYFNKMGIDIVTVSNNHALDFGKDAFVENLDVLDNANIIYVGGGRNLDEAKEIRYFDTSVGKIAYVAASRVIPVTNWNATNQSPGLLTTYDTGNVLPLIKEAKMQADYVVIYVHWGIERNDKPEEYQRKMAKEYIDAGADIVVGSHPHVLQGIEYYNGKPIIYSLGNYIFSNEIKRTALLEVEIEKNQEAKVFLYPALATNAKTSLVTKDSQIIEFNKYMESISYGIKMESNGQILTK